MPGQTLLLIKHAQPEIDPGQPARDWPLSDLGRRQSLALAERLRHYDIRSIITSREPKAAETGRIVAASLAVPVREADDLHEHDRSNEPYGAPAQFEAAVRNLFAHPSELVYGLETADQAERRFSRAVQSVLDQNPAGSIAVVAHGTVIALFVARAAGWPPFDLWRRLGLPSFVVMSLPDYSVHEVVADI